MTVIILISMFRDEAVLLRLGHGPRSRLVEIVVRVDERVGVNLIHQLLMLLLSAQKMGVIGRSL